MSDTPPARKTFKARRTAAAVPCVRCGKEFTKTIFGRGRCKACVEEEAAKFREAHCANCGLEKKDDSECTYLRPFHLGTFEVNRQSDFWDSWTDQNGSPDTDRCKTEYGREGGYIWSGCGCTIGPEKEDDCEVTGPHADWPEAHPLNCEECDVKMYYCQRDAEDYQLDAQGHWDAGAEEEGDEGDWQDEDEGDFEGDEGEEYPDYEDEGDETAGYDGEEDPEEDLAGDDDAGLSPDEDEEARPVSVKTQSPLLGGSVSRVRAVWLLNKGGNTHFDENSPAESLPTIVAESTYSAGAPNSPFVETVISVAKLQDWCAVQGYEEIPTRLCAQFGVSLRCFARKPTSARTPINVVATQLTSDSIDSLNTPVFGRALLIRYDSNGTPVDFPRDELIRLLFFVNDIFQMLFDSLELSPEHFAAWKVCFPYYDPDPSTRDTLSQFEITGSDGRSMDGKTGRRSNMELVPYFVRLKERESNTPGELPNLAAMTLSENKQGASDTAEAVKFHTPLDSSISSPSAPSTLSKEEKKEFPYQGARCIIKGLKKKPQLNGKTGELVGSAGGRWTVRVVKEDGSLDAETHDLLPANFTQDMKSTPAVATSTATTAANTVRVAELAPCAKATSLDSIPLTESFLPPADKSQLEAVEKAYLKSTRGWKNPQSLEAYSIRGEYRDLTAYFDADDETSPLNELAMRTFCGFKKATIRGSVVITRSEPPLAMNFGQSPFGSGPMPTAFAEASVRRPQLDLGELRETLSFYTTKDARKVAQERDFQRASGSFKQTQS